jgi:hypothetical protein
LFLRDYGRVGCLVIVVVLGSLDSVAVSRTLRLRYANKPAPKENKNRATMASYDDAVAGKLLGVQH